jgi:hypothetical protein
MATGRKLDYKGWWMVPVCFLISGLAILPESPYRICVQNVLGVPHRVDSPELYLLERVATGLSAGSGLLLILVLAAFTGRRSWYWTFWGVFVALTLLMYPIAYAIALLWRSLNLIDPTKAESLMRDHVLEDRTFWFGFSSAMAFGVFWFVVAVIQRFRLRQSIGADGGAAAGSKK